MLYLFSIVKLGWKNSASAPPKPSVGRISNA